MTDRLPEAWSGIAQLDGLELVAKDELLGDPFLINTVWFTTNDKGVSFVYVEAERPNGQRFNFNDSSTGVRAQIVEYLTQRGHDHIVDTGEEFPMALVIPRGLRKSEFDAVVEENGRKVTKKARVFYLTTSGKRAAAPAPEPAPKGGRRASTAK